MVGWMGRNIISREASVVLKIYKTKIRPQHRILYSGLDFSVKAWKLEGNIQIGGHTKMSDKTNIKNERLQL